MFGLFKKKKPIIAYCDCPFCTEIIVSMVDRQKMLKDE